MNKRVVIALLLFLSLLGGCGKTKDDLSNKLNTFIESSIKKGSAIEEDEEYIRYKQISEEEKIDEHGFYYSDDVDYNVLEDTDAVHVTFANNSYIDVMYFADSALTVPLNDGGAYLHANDCIYAEIQDINNPNTDAYVFKKFEVWEYDEKGKKEKELDTEPFEDNLVYQIPMDSKDKEIAILPIGEYTLRNIELNDYYKDNNGVDSPLAGKWNINGDDTTDKYISVNPVAPYTVTYTYDPNAFVFVGSEPSCLYNNEIDGIVNFEEFSPDQQINSISIELHKKSGDQEFDPQRYQIEHADIEYKYQDVLIEEPIFIPIDAKISYEITRIDDGYWTPDGQNGEVEVSNISEVIEDLVCKDEDVTITLPQPEKGGTITYSINGKVLNGSSIEAPVGTKIIMTFQRKNGWNCEVEDGTAYTVESKKVQKININGKDVNEVFTEQEFKPVVSLTIDKSVGTFTEFSISTVDGEDSGLKLEDSPKTKEVFSKEVGTKNDLVLAASNGALLDGEALKVDVHKETVDGNKEKDIQYIKKIPDNIIISLYITDSNTVYKSIKLTVSKVSILEVTNQEIPNGSIKIETTDLTYNRALRSGDVIEKSRKIHMSISAKDGYYVMDSGKTEIYSDTMKYSKYLTDAESIINKHPVKKLCSVTLDARDPFGVVSFKADGKEVESGVCSFKEEQKLEMTYEITDGKHIIYRDGSNWLENTLNKTKNKTKETIIIPINSSLDGERIARDTYINVKDK